MIDTLSLLYVVLAVAIIPIATLLCMVLWRVFKILGSISNLTDMVDRGVNFVASKDSAIFKMIKKIAGKE